MKASARRRDGATIAATVLILLGNGIPVREAASEETVAELNTIVLSNGVVAGTTMVSVGVLDMPLHTQLCN